MLAATVKQFWLAGYQCFFFHAVHHANIEHMLYYSTVHLVSVREGLFAGVIIVNISILLVYNKFRNSMATTGV